MASYVPPALRTKVSPDTKRAKHVNIDVSSPTEFPDIGRHKTSQLSKQLASSASTVSTPKKTTSTLKNFADLAKAWADKDEDDRMRKEQEEQQKVIEEAKIRPVYFRYSKTQNVNMHNSYSSSSYKPYSSLADDVYTSEYEDSFEHDIHDRHNDRYDEYVTLPSNNTSANPLGISRDDFK